MLNRYITAPSAHLAVTIFPDPGNPPIFRRPFVLLLVGAKSRLAIMSIVQTGLLRKHYEEALEDVEYKSSAFWQAVLLRNFWESDLYSVTAECSPDGSLRRVDMVVKRYDADHHTLSALLWVECKRPSGGVQEVEDQALDAAGRCIDKDNLMWIWAMTTTGTSFRLWFIDARLRRLQAV